MKIAIFALFLALACGLLFGFSAWIEKLAYRRRNRYYHIRIVIIMAIAMLAAMNVYTVSRLIEIADWIINNPTLAAVFNLLLPNRAYALVYMLLMILLLNLFVAMIALVTVLVVKLLFAWRKKYIRYNETTGINRVLLFPWWIVNQMYEESDAEVCLRPKGFSFGKWAKGFKIAFGVLWVAQVMILAVSILWGGARWNELLLNMTKIWYLLPMASYFIMQQIQLFLEGSFYDEAGGFSSADISTELHAAVEELQKLYHNRFKGSGAIVLSDYHVEKRATTGLQGNRLGNRQIRDCKNKEILEVVVNHIKQSDLHMNDTYKNALVELLNGNSVNICDHCDGDFLLYLCAYLNFYIAQGKTVLVLCPTEKRVEQVTAAVDQAMRRLNNLCSVWNIDTLEDNTDHNRTNVLVCTAEAFVRDNVVERRKNFLADLFCTVLADGFELFSQDCIRTHRLFSALRGVRGLKQYILFTGGNNDNLRTAVEKVTQTELLPFCHNMLTAGTGIMVWKEESMCRIQRNLGVGNALSPYMGVAIPLAVFAAKFDMDKVHIVESLSRPDRSFWDVLSMTQTELAHFLQKSVNLQSMIRTDNSEILNDKGEKIIVAYDEECNFYHALWRWAKYGGNGNTLIHIISPPYMLREYFAAKYHSNRLLLRTNDFDPLISYSQGTKMTRMAVLLVTLCKEAMSEQELMQKSREYGWSYKNAVDLLRDCLRVVLTDHEIHSVYSFFQFSRGKAFNAATGNFEQQTYIRLTDELVKERLEQKSQLVQLVTQNRQYPLPILVENVSNYFLRGQVVAIDGYFYQINKIGNGNVYAEQKNHSDAPEYMQICDFTFSDYRRTDDCVDTEPLDINICSADVTRRIYGYWETNRGNCFGCGTGPMLHDLRGETGGMEVSYENASVLEINITRSALGDNPRETVRLFAYALKELFRTLFPYSYQNLFTAVRESDCASYAKRVFDGASGLEEKAASLIPTVADGFDTPADDKITLYVIEASCLEYGMVQMLYKRRREVFRMLREYLQWYRDAQQPAQAPEDAENTQKEAAQETVCGRYLHFGGEQIPNVFSLDGLLQLCDRLVLMPDDTAAEPVAEEEIQVEGLRTCSFCGASTLRPIELKEGNPRRIMCRECWDHQCTAEDEIRILYQNVFGSMTRDYGITLPGNLTVRFQTAEAIRKFTGVGGQDGRVLGFYYHAGRQLWLEARGPEVALRSTLFHELTHAWQHHDQQFDDALQYMLRTFKRKYRALVRLLLVEGHAMYVEIDGMWEHHEMMYAERLCKTTEAREDEYGIGYRFVKTYLEEYRTEGSHITPFVAMLRLIEDIAEGKEQKDQLLAIVKQILEG